MLVLLATVAYGGERDPLPALAVERPLGTPLGWLQVRLDEDAGPAGTRGALALRYGVLPRIELGLAVGAGGQPLDVRTALRVRTTLLRTEPPNRSVVVDLELRPPSLLRDEPLIGTVAIAGAEQIGPLLLSARAGRSWPGGWPIDAQVLLQVGPLAPFGALRYRDEALLGGGLEVQLSRGLEVHGELLGSVTGSIDTSRIGVGMAF